MTFRIDGLWREETVWTFDIKGIEGQGIYGDLQTGPDGRGLYLLGYRKSLRLVKVRQLLSEDEFSVALSASKEEAARILAQGLHRLGWGPEVDQLHRIIACDEDD